MTIGTLQAQVAAARADVDAADHALRAALLDGQPTAAAGTFLADADADLAAAVEELSAANADAQRQMAAAAAACVDCLAAAAQADLDRRLSLFIIPPAPVVLNLKD